MRQRGSGFDRGLGNGSVPMTKPVSFFSTCPACGQQQLQLAYTRRALLSLLKTGNIIDAYCLACDVVWPVSAGTKPGGCSYCGGPAWRHTNTGG